MLAYSSSLSNRDLARTLHRLAKEDCTLENVGRIIVSDAAKLTQTPTLNGTQIIALLQQYYSKAGYGYDLRTENVLLVYFDGKQPLREKRSQQTPANCVVNHFGADTENVFQAERHEDPEEYHAPKPDSERIIW